MYLFFDIKDKGRDPFNQNFRKFRSKTQWIGSIQTEKFRKNWSTFWGGPLFPVEPVWILVEWIAPKDTSVTDLQQDLISIRNRGFNNSLLINPGKTKLIVFRTKQTLSRLDDFKLSPLGKEVTPCDSVRDIWIYVDSQLSYDEHILKTVSSCVSRLCQINRVKRLFDKKTLKFETNTLVFSRLFYYSSVWSNDAKKNVNKSQLVQIFAARISLCKYDHVTPILKSLN